MRSHSTTLYLESIAMQKKFREPIWLPKLVRGMHCYFQNSINKVVCLLTESFTGWETPHPWKLGWQHTTPSGNQLSWIDGTEIWSGQSEWDLVYSSHNCQFGPQTQICTVAAQPQFVWLHRCVSHFYKTFSKPLTNLFICISMCSICIVACRPVEVVHFSLSQASWQEPKMTRNGQTP